MHSDHTRKLAVIMFTDIVGYSRMMSADEDHALGLLDLHDTLLTAIISEHNGHVLKRMGDAIFAEFESATLAVRCGIRIQERLRDHNQSAAPGDRLSVRIGIHLGDVVVRDNDLFGEGINVAARLEPLAKPGGICISEAVYRAVKRQAGVEPVLVGEVELKNIVERHVVYQFPPFYDLALPAEGGKRPLAGSDKGAGLKLTRTELLPGASLYSHVVLAAAITIGGMIAGAASAALWFDSRSDGWRFTQADFQDGGQVVRRLMASQSGLEQQVWRTFSGESRRELAGLIAEGAPPSSHADLTWNLRRQLNNVVTGARQLDPPGDGSAGQFSEQNRRTLEKLFPDQVAVLAKSRSMPEFIFAMLGDVSLLPRRIVQPLMAFLLGLFGLTAYSVYATRPASRRYVFDDIRDVDEVIEYLIREMGFMAPVREGKVLRFRASLKTMLIWNVYSIAVRIDGNSIIVSGASIFLQRITRSFETLSGTAAPPAPVG